VLDHLPALVLAAGLGTRLRPLTLARAKPAIPVAGEPLIRRIVATLVAQGCADIVVNLHHLPHTVTAVLGDGSDIGARIRYSWEHPLVLGSAGGPRQALDILGANTFLIVNGDTLTDVDLDAMAFSHAASGALVSLALIPNREPHRYNGVQLDDRQRIVRFVARGPAAVGSFHLVGIQIASADVFSRLPRGVPAESIRGIYDELIVRQPGSLYGFVCEALFHDVGTVADYLATSRALSTPGKLLCGEGTRIAPSAVLRDTILWDDVTVEAGARLDRCIVTDGVRIDASAAHSDVIVMRGADGAAVSFPVQE
jgi:NDP-sugar pyrophosphorylase family protein